MKSGKAIKRRLAALLSMIMILSSVPVHADVLLNDENTPAEAYQEELLIESTGAEEAEQEAALFETTGPEEELFEETEPEDIFLEYAEPEITVQEDSAIEETEASPDTASSDQVKKADITIMYYLVGSNLERTGWEATKDMVEMMVGIDSAGSAYDPEKVNLIAETGGVAFEDDDTSSASTKKAQRESEKKALKDKYSVSENTKFDSLSSIDWTKNHRWKLSANSITTAKNDAGINREAIMSGKKSTKKSPELTDFIVSSITAYPAEQYMLVLWDHGGGPKDGFGGDDRAPEGGDYGYITSDQLSNAIKEAKTLLGSDTVSENDLDKFAMLGFDACLMGNLETSLAMSSYADYLVGSEDLEPGTGWDHRGYVRDICSMTSDDFGKDKINKSVEKLGKVICDDSIRFYDPKTENTMSIVKLDLEKLKGLDAKLDALGVAIRHQLINGADPISTYTKLYNAAAKSVCFNGAASGILDLYSLVKNISERFVGERDELIKSAAADIAALLDPASPNEENPVVYERHVETFYGGANTLGGLTVFYPYLDNRYELSDNNEVADGLKDYLNIYCKNSPIDKDHRLGEGYLNFVGDFCAIQAMGYEVGSWRNESKTDEEIRAKMKGILEGEGVKSGVGEDYSLSSDDINWLKTFYSGNNDLVSMRVSANDVKVKSIPINNDLKYVCDVNEDHVPIINNGRQTLLLGSTNGKDQYRLGSVPLASEPAAKDGVSRFVLDNYDTANWFFIEDTQNNRAVPASILDIRRRDGGEAGIIDVFDNNNSIIVYFSMAQKVDYEGGYYQKETAMAVSFDAGSDTGTIMGVYDVDMDRKELNRYVPWAPDNETEFTPVSDMGDMFAGNTNNYTSGNPYNFIYSEAVIGKNLRITRGKTLHDLKKRSAYFKDWSFEFYLKDYFGSDYGLTFWETGEPATAEIELLNGKDKADYIKKGTPLSINKLFYTSQYYMYFTKDEPGIGYYTEDKQFHALAGSDDIAKLDAGTYEIVFEYTNDDGSIAPGEGAMVSVNDISRERNASNYVFIPAEPAYVLTVIDEGSKELTISGNNSIPYGVYRTLRYSDLSNIVSVKYGEADMSKSPYVSYELTVSGRHYEFSRESEDSDFCKTGLRPGDEVTVTASLKADGKVITTVNPAVTEIDRQDVEIIGEPIDDKIYQYNLEELYWSRNKSVNPKIKIAMYIPWDNAAADRVIEGDAFINGQMHSFDELLSSNDIKKIFVNTSSVDDPKTYNNLPLGPDNGKDRAGEFTENDWKSSFNALYRADTPSRIYVEKYTVNAAAEVMFYSLKEDKQLLDGTMIVYGDADPVNNTYRVSDNSIRVMGPEVKSWYMKIGNQAKALVYGNGKTCQFNENNCVISVSDGTWKFFIPTDAISKRVIFYADYDENQSSYEETGSTKFNITINDISPVEYTGKPIVTMTSGKTGSKMIDLIVKAGDRKLVEGVDYTVSYKNNKNAAGITDKKKAPTLTIKGKGDYKKMNAVAYFTILPVDLSNVPVTVNKSYAPFTSSGKLSVAVNLNLPTGVKVASKDYKLCFYDSDYNELTAAMMKEMYKGNSTVSVMIKAVAVTQSKNPQNYTPGSETDYVYVTGYPKGGSNLTVKFKSTKKPFNPDGYKVEDIVKDCLDESKLKVKKALVDVEELNDVTAYLDKNLTRMAGEDGTGIYDTGTYYLAFELNDEAKTKYSSYKPTVVKFDITGTNISKGKTKLTDSKPKLENSGSDVPITIEFDKDKCKATEFKINLTTMDGASYTYTAGYDTQGRNYDMIIDEDGKLKLPQSNVYLANGAKGSYKITVEACGACKGKFTLSYKVI